MIQAAFAPLAIDAVSTVKGQSASFVTNSSDYLGFDTNGIKVRLEAWKGRWGITADNTLANFSAESRIDNANTVKLKGYDASTELGGSYLIAKQSFGQTAGMMYEGMAGGRFVALRQELDYSSGVSVADKKAYVDPYVGARITWIMSRIWSFDVRGNVGGFGLGSGSELTWMVMPEVNLHISDSFIVNLGYRNYDVRTEKETGSEPTQFDGRVYGTFLGVEVRLQ